MDSGGNNPSFKLQIFGPNATHPDLQVRHPKRARPALWFAYLRSREYHLEDYAKHGVAVGPCGQARAPPPGPATDNHPDWPTFLDDRKGVGRPRVEHRRKSESLPLRLHNVAARHREAQTNCHPKSVGHAAPPGDRVAEASGHKTARLDRDEVQLAHDRCQPARVAGRWIGPEQVEQCGSAHRLDTLQGHSQARLPWVAREHLFLARGFLHQANKTHRLLPLIK
jgi:hypothetical protein